MTSKIYKNLKISETVKIGSGSFGDKIYIEYLDDKCTNDNSYHRADIYANSYGNECIKIVDIITSKKNLGYGTKLMNHLLFHLKKNHSGDFKIYGEMWIEEDKNSNKNRRNFFKKFGFSLKGKNRVYIDTELKNLKLYLPNILKNDLYKLNINDRDISYFCNKLEKYSNLKINEKFILTENVNQTVKISDIVGVCEGNFDGSNWIDILKNEEYVGFINKITNDYKNNKITKDQIISNIKLINYKSDIFDHNVHKLEGKYFIANEIRYICYFVILRFLFIQDKTSYKEEFNIESRLYKKSVQTRFENLEKISKNLNRSKKLKNTLLLKIVNNEFYFEVEVQKLFSRKSYSYSFEESSFDILTYTNFNFLDKFTLFLNKLLVFFLNMVYYLFYPVFFILEKILKK